MGLAKTRKKMLTLQVGQLTFLAASNAVLGAVTGVMMNITALVRNMICLKVKYTLPLKLGIAAILVTLGVCANDRGIIGMLPVAGTLLITLCLDIENIVILKTVYILSQCAWIFYDIAVKNYVSAATDAFGITANIIGIISVRKHAAKN